MLTPCSVITFLRHEKNGMAVGAYHYYSLCKSAKEQADNFIKNVPAVPGDLPPVLDIEFVGNCKKRPDVDSLHNELKEFMSKLKETYGVDPVIYTTERFYKEYRMHAFKNNFYG